MSSQHADSLAVQNLAEAHYLLWSEKGGMPQNGHQMEVKMMISYEIRVFSEHFQRPRNSVQGPLDTSRKRWPSANDGYMMSQPLMWGPSSNQA